jgi:hypothetical protein
MERYYDLPSEPQTFSNAFPEIATITIHVEQKKKGWDAEPSLSQYTKDNFPGEHISCENLLCRRGGFPVMSMIYKMTREQQAEKSQVEWCSGYQGSGLYPNCPNNFTVKVSIAFRESTRGGDGRKKSRAVRLA